MAEPAMNVIRGTLDYLILRTLGTGDALHGFEILDWIHGSTDGELLIEEGALYPALHRMEKRGWLSAQWGISERGRKAKYYSLTLKGRTALTHEDRRWSRYVAAVDRIMPRSAES